MTEVFPGAYAGTKLKEADVSKLFRIMVAFFRGTACPECNSYNVKLKRWAVVNPEHVEDARCICAGYSIAAALGMRSAEGNYKKTSCGDIYQTRDVTCHCYNCGGDFTVRRERVVARAP